MIKLKTSNKYKISEYQRLLSSENIIIEEGEDLKEILGTADEVIMYKAIDAGENILVEDATLIINGREEVEIKWKADSLKTGDYVTWVISLGIVRNGILQVYKAQTDLIVDRSLGNDGVAFEPFLIPINNNPNKLSYTVLSKKIDKDIIDPRAMAIKKFLNNDLHYVIDSSEIKPWEGKYQND